MVDGKTIGLALAAGVAAEASGVTNIVGEGGGGGGVGGIMPKIGGDTNILKPGQIAPGAPASPGVDAGGGMGLQFAGLISQMQANQADAFSELSNTLDTRLDRLAAKQNHLAGQLTESTSNLGKENYPWLTDNGRDSNIVSKMKKWRQNFINTMTDPEINVGSGDGGSGSGGSRVRSGGFDLRPYVANPEPGVQAGDVIAGAGTAVRGGADVVHGGVSFVATGANTLAQASNLLMGETASTENTYMTTLLGEPAKKKRLYEGAILPTPFDDGTSLWGTNPGQNGGGGIAGGLEAAWNAATPNIGGSGGDPTPGGGLAQSLGLGGGTSKPPSSAGGGTRKMRRFNADITRPNYGGGEKTNRSGTPVREGIRRKIRGR